MDGDEGGIHDDRHKVGVIWGHSGPAEVESNNSLWEGRTSQSNDRVKGARAGQIVRVQVGREHVGWTVAHRCSRERGKAVKQVRRLEGVQHE